MLVSEPRGLGYSLLIKKRSELGDVTICLMSSISFIQPFLMKEFTVPVPSVFCLLISSVCVMCFDVVRPKCGHFP